MFTRQERSTFKYWFAHWCAFNMTALNLKCWKFKYLFHDIEKPWLKLFMDYPKVQKWHREHNSHHLEYYDKHGDADWEAMMIDWECSHFTKLEEPLDAFGEYNRIIKEKPQYGYILNEKILPLLYKFNLVFLNESK